MPELLQVYKRQRKYLLFLMFLYLLGSFYPSFRPVSLGLLLGTSVSLFNLWLLAKKTISVTSASVTGKRSFSLGTGTRIAMAVLAVMFADYYTEWLNVLSVIIGIMTSYVVIMIDFFAGLFQQRKCKVR
ncbi:ATP synthase subunit I [Heyndrickxia acidiproducens]|uniref:ATP synthase subunit I n=1 Tax=Heyndrickxia acidiproducens TaxID=1121084 RepID=UPI000368E5D4|nr:ATP synthase subunit I [Heyndrickxia acidiproducens]